MKNIVKLIISIVVIVVVLTICWQWGFCRFYVGPNEMATLAC